jgi:hypothetical protein
MRRKPEKILTFDRHEFSNGDLLPLLRKLAQEKQIRIDVSSRLERAFKKVAMFLIMVFAVYVSIHILLRVVK